MHKSFELEVQAGQFIRGYIHGGAGDTKKPCIIFCHGFTGDMVEPHFMYVKMARALEKIGIVSIRFDFLGSGESDGEFSEMTFSQEVENCQAVLEYVQSLDFVDSERINILGFSLGAVVAIYSAVHNEHRIKNLLLISTAANMQDVLTRDIRGDRIRSLLENRMVDFNGCLFSREAIDEIFSLNIYDQLKQVTAGVCAVHGTEDEAVPPFVSVYIKELLGERCEMTFIDGADHHYSSVEYEHKLIDVITTYSRRSILNV